MTLSDRSLIPYSIQKLKFVNHQIQHQHKLHIQFCDQDQFNNLNIIR